MEWSRSLCKNCSGPLCTECFKFHSKMKELKSHELEQSPDDPLIEEAASHLKSELNCKLHSNVSSFLQMVFVLQVIRYMMLMKY